MRLGFSVDQLNSKCQFSREPFPWWVIDDFLPENVALQLYNKFPKYSNSGLQAYDNALEVKKIQSRWNDFDPYTYQFISFLNSAPFPRYVEELTGQKDLISDNGLHGAGQFLHQSGGKLNPHLDYQIHPKLSLERKLSFLLYLTPDWQPDWNGDLCLYENTNNELTLSQRIHYKFNRAVIFETTNSWHGVPDPIACPLGTIRTAIGVFYLVEADQDINQNDLRLKAQYAPLESQKDDQAVLELIQLRMDPSTSKSVYY